MHDDDRIEEAYRERADHYHARAERRARRWAARRERRAERRAMRYAGWYDPMGFWSGGPRGPSALTLRLRDMMKQVDAISARVASLEKITAGSDAQLAAEIERLARGPAASLGR